MEDNIRKRVVRLLNTAAIPIGLILLWQYLSSSHILNELFLPSPVQVIKGLVEMAEAGTLWLDIAVSFRRVILGCLWGILSGLILGIISGFSKPVARILEPIINVIRQISIYAWIPLIILWFGIGETSKVIIIVRSVIIPVYINALAGIREVKKEYAELSEVLELNKLVYLRKIILPSAAPSIFTGLRLSVSNAWTAVVAAEMLGGLTGIGYALLNAKDFMRSDQLIALMAVIAVIGVFLDKLLLLTEKKIFSWKTA